MAHVELRAEPPYEDVIGVVQNMRARDREEIYATRFGEDPDEVARDVIASGAFRWGAYLDGKCVALIGAHPRWPNVWTAWAFGTDDWNRVVLTLSKHVRRFMIPALYRAGAVRVDAMALATHMDARLWLTAMGAEPEKPLANWGKNGQTFVCYVWTRQAAKQALTRSGRLPLPPKK